VPVPEFPTVSSCGFEAGIAFGEVVELTLAGSSDARTAPQLRALIDRLHVALRDAGRSQVVVDITGLEFMAAATFDVFVTWFDLIHELAPESRYRLKFRPDPRSGWQSRSLHTLSCFASDLVLVGDAT
jgi:hypothetical protein